MAGNLQPLDEKFAIVGSDGRPTLYFIQWAQQRQIDITGAITEAQFDELLLAYLAAHTLHEGSGIQITPPSGNLSDNPTIAADAQEILDQISTNRGDIIYRGLLGWAALVPGAAGLFLKTQGAGADPVWAATGGGGGNWWAGHIPAAADFPNNQSGDAINTTVTDDADLGMKIDYGNMVSSKFRVRSKNLPSAGAADWTVTARLMCEPVINTIVDFGLCLLESATAKFVSIGLLFNGGATPQIRSERGTLTAFAAALTANPIVGGIPVWLRANYVNATGAINLYYSYNGKDYVAAQATTSNAVCFTTRADKIGFICVNGSTVGFPCRSYCDYWVQTF